MMVSERHEPGSFGYSFALFKGSISNMAVSEFRRRYAAGDIIELILLVSYQAIIAVVVVSAVKRAFPRIAASSSHMLLQAASLMHGIIASILK